MQIIDQNNPFDDKFKEETQLLKKFLAVIQAENLGQDAAKAEKIVIALMALKVNKEAVLKAYDNYQEHKLKKKKNPNPEKENEKKVNEEKQEKKKDEQDTHNLCVLGKNIKSATKNEAESSKEVDDSGTAFHLEGYPTREDCAKSIDKIISDIEDVITWGLKEKTLPLLARTFGVGCCLESHVRSLLKEVLYLSGQRPPTLDELMAEITLMTKTKLPSTQLAYYAAYVGSKISHFKNKTDYEEKAVSKKEVREKLQDFGVFEESDLKKYFDTEVEEVKSIRDDLSLAQKFRNDFIGIPEVRSFKISKIEEKLKLFSKEEFMRLIPHLSAQEIDLTLLACVMAVDYQKALLIPLFYGRNIPGTHQETSNEDTALIHSLKRIIILATVDNKEYEVQETLSLIRLLIPKKVDASIRDAELFSALAHSIVVDVKRPSAQISQLIVEHSTTPKGLRGDCLVEMARFAPAWSLYILNFLTGLNAGDCEFKKIKNQSAFYFLMAYRNQENIQIFNQLIDLYLQKMSQIIAKEDAFICAVSYLDWPLAKRIFASLEKEEKEEKEKKHDNKTELNAHHLNLARSQMWLGKQFLKENEPVKAEKILMLARENFYILVKKNYIYARAVRNLIGEDPVVLQFLAQCQAKRADTDFANEKISQDIALYVQAFCSNRKDAIFKETIIAKLAELQLHFFAREETESFDKIVQENNDLDIQDDIWQALARTIGNQFKQQFSKIETLNDLKKAIHQLSAIIFNYSKINYLSSIDQACLNEIDTPKSWQILYLKLAFIYFKRGNTVETQKTLQKSLQYNEALTIDLAWNNLASFILHQVKSKSSTENQYNSFSEIEDNIQHLLLAKRALDKVTQANETTKTITEAILVELARIILLAENVLKEEFSKMIFPSFCNVLVNTFYQIDLLSRENAKNFKNVITVLSRTLVKEALRLSNKQEAIKLLSYACSLIFVYDDPESRKCRIKIANHSAQYQQQLGNEEKETKNKIEYYVAAYLNYHIEASFGKFDFDPAFKMINILIQLQVENISQVEKFISIVEKAIEKHHPPESFEGKKSWSSVFWLDFIYLQHRQGYLCYQAKNFELAETHCNLAYLHTKRVPSSTVPADHLLRDLVCITFSAGLQHAKNKNTNESKQTFDRGLDFFETIFSKAENNSLLDQLKLLEKKLPCPFTPNFSSSANDRLWNLFSPLSAEKDQSIINACLRSLAGTQLSVASNNSEKFESKLEKYQEEKSLTSNEKSYKAIKSLLLAIKFYDCMRDPSKEDNDIRQKTHKKLAEEYLALASRSLLNSNYSVTIYCAQRILIFYKIQPLQDQCVEILKESYLKLALQDTYIKNYPAAVKNLIQAINCFKQFSSEVQKAKETELEELNKLKKHWSKQEKSKFKLTVYSVVCSQPEIPPTQQVVYYPTPTKTPSS